MLIDLDHQPAGASYASQICILGAGIAGLILAHKLAAAGFQINLLEAGGLEPEDRSQAFYNAESAGQRNLGITEGRFRTFGGSSTRWGAQLLPYTPDIFIPPAGSPSTPWPITATAVEPHYPEILRIMGADDLPFDAGLLPALGHPAVPFSDAIHLRFSKWAPFRLRSLVPTLGRECLAHTNVTVFTHANAVLLEPTPSGGAIASVTAKNYANATFTFTAARFIVCLGTIESARLLLVSQVRAPALNPHSQAGLYFHDHISMRAAAFEGPARAQILDRMGPFFVAGTLHTAKLEASPELRGRERLPAVMAHIVIEEPEDSGVAAVRNLLRSLQRGNLRQAIGSSLLPMLAGIGGVARLLWFSSVLKRRAVSPRARVSLNIDVEQLPPPENRIRLSSRLDALDQPKAIVDWRISPSDYDTALRYAPIIDRELRDAGIAPFPWLPGVLAPTSEPPPMADTYHHMGGLRMGTDPQTSVVDPDLKVHGIDNLYVASCAVFPAGGSSNPTFTLMALTLRLAIHLTQSGQTSQ